MKRTPYKMSGYTYPGTSPARVTKNTSKIASTKEMTDQAFDSFEAGTDLMKEEGFTVKTTPVTKKSPAKNAEAVKSIDWDKITQSAVEAGVEGAVQIGVSAISNSGKKRPNRGMDQSGFSKMKFGS